MLRLFIFILVKIQRMIWPPDCIACNDSGLLNDSMFATQPCPECNVPIRCAQCNGGGYVYYDDGHGEAEEINCPACEGKGVMWP